MNDSYAVDVQGVEKRFGGVPALLINIACGSDSDSD